MRLSIFHFFASIVASATSSNRLNNLRRLADVADAGLIEEEFLDTLSEEKKARALDGAGCDEICIARQRLVRCKRTAREEKREGRNAWRKIGDVHEGKRLRLYCEYRYRWQEKNRYCPDYCLEASTKRSGATLEIKDCSRSPLQKFKNVDGILRPAWSNSLCVKSDKLRNCDSELIGLKDSGHFEIKLKERKNKRREKCFSNPHVNTPV